MQRKSCTDQKKKQKKNKIKWNTMLGKGTDLIKNDTK